MGFRKKTIEAQGSKTLTAHRKDRAQVKAKEAKQRMDEWKTIYCFCGFKKERQNVWRLHIEECPTYGHKMKEEEE